MAAVLAGKGSSACALAGLESLASIRLDMSSAFWVVCQYVDHYSINILTHISFALVAHPSAPSLLSPSRQASAPQSRPSANRKQSSFCLSSISISFDERTPPPPPLLLLHLPRGCLGFVFDWFVPYRHPPLFPGYPFCLPLWHTSKLWRSLAPRDLHFRLTIVRGAYVAACPPSFVPPPFPIFVFRPHLNWIWSPLLFAAFVSFFLFVFFNLIRCFRRFVSQLSTL